jgi:L-alanine-DL-glutamate epimerase-like enolase superfamily enzyme
MDPFQFEQLTEIFNNSVRQGINPWALDLALWDIVGKAAGQPVYKLLGGHKDRVIPYASCTNDYELEERVEAIQRLIDEGWKAAKIHIVPDLPIMDNLKLITAVRKAAGDKMRIAVDTHQYGNFPKWGLQEALTFGRELDNMGNFLWMEDCLPRQDYIGMQQLTAALSTPVSCGGISAPLAEIAKLLSTNCLDQIQPGAGCNESVWNLRKMITLCETHYKSYSPHTWCSIDTVAGLHLAAATPSCTYVESHYDPPAQPMMLVNLLLKEPIQFNKDDGTYSVPQTPGWGVDLDEELIERYCER